LWRGNGWRIPFGLYVPIFIPIQIASVVNSMSKWGTDCCRRNGCDAVIGSSLDVLCFQRQQLRDCYGIAYF
jgi:hypothetical protein